MINFKVNMVAIWAGTSTKPLDKWMKYTDGIENPRRKPPIVKDFGDLIEYDFFYIHVMENDEIVPIERLIREGAMLGSQDIIQEAAEKARSLGIFEGNRLYVYTRCEFFPEDLDKKYNDLTFIGNFKDKTPSG